MQDMRTVNLTPYNADATTLTKHEREAAELANEATEHTIELLAKTYNLSPYEVVVVRLWFCGLVRHLTPMIMALHDLGEPVEYPIYRTLVNFFKEQRKMGF